MTKTALLIPTFNANILWHDVLKQISLQSTQPNEKIIVDSGSSDSTINSAKHAGFKIIEIDKSAFNHGATRQLLVDNTDADICIFLTQDAILSSPESISNIVKAFDDPKVGIAYGRQLPHKNAQPLEIHARLFNYPNTPEVVSIADIDQKGFKVFFCSNSFSAYRRSALINVGFHQIQ